MNEKLKVFSRLHHNAHVTTDMVATRKFYEDIIGFPLVATTSIFQYEMSLKGGRDSNMK